MKTKIFIILFFFVNLFLISTKQISKNDLINQIVFSKDTKSWNKNFRNKLYEGNGIIIKNNNKEILVKINDKKYPVFLILSIDQLSLKNKIHLQKLVDKNINFKAQLKKYDKDKKNISGELLFIN